MTSTMRSTITKRVPRAISRITPLLSRKITFSSRSWTAYGSFTVKTKQKPPRRFSCSAGRTAALSLAAAALVTSHIMAAEPPAPRKVATVEGITEYQYDNGLRALLFPDNSQSKVTVNLTVLVGSRHEGYGETRTGAFAQNH